MGFLLFAYNKISLKRQISDMQYRLTCVSRARREAASQLAEYQKSITNYKNMGNVFANGLLMQSQQELEDKYSQYKNEKGEIPPAKIQEMMMEDQKNRYQIANASARFNSVFESMSSGREEQIKNYSVALDEEQDQLQRQIALMQAEVKSYEDAEKDAIKDMVPKFGSRG